MNVVWKVLLAIVGLVVIHSYVEPLLLPLYPPLGIIGVIALYVAIVAWIFGLI